MDNPLGFRRLQFFFLLVVVLDSFPIYVTDRIRIPFSLSDKNPLSMGLFWLSFSLGLQSDYDR